MTHLKHTIPAALLALALLSQPLAADTFTVTAPHYLSNPGAVITVPISLDNAAGIASIHLQLNYDDQVLALTNVTAGALGSQFDISHGIADGAITINLIRATELTAGAGNLVLLDFLTNPGATTDLYSDLALAQFEISDESALRDLTVANTIQTVNGSISVSLSTSIDNGPNGLPDWWEFQNGLNPLLDLGTGDNDGDTLDNFFEFAFGGNPLLHDFAQVYPQSEVQDFNGSPYLTLTYRRRTAPTSVTYLLHEGDTLQTWTDADPNTRLTAPAIDQGNGLEQVTVHGELPLNDPALPQKGFMQVEATVSE